MKKQISVIITIMFLFSLMVTGITPAEAASWPPPTAVAITGDTSFTVTIVDPAKIMGASIVDGEKIYPTGFNQGEVQFGGKALILSGIESGSQQLCFAFPTYSAGWRGNVYQWNGAKWVKMATTIAEGEDGTITKACATSYGNGTYALIISYTEQAKTLPQCDMEFGTSLEYDGNEGSIYEFHWIMGLFPEDWLGKKASFKIIVEPSSAAWGPGLSDSGPITVGEPAEPGDYHFWSTKTFFVDMEQMESWRIHITLPECQVTMNLGIG
jgi:hypothetical protein